MWSLGLTHKRMPEGTWVRREAADRDNEWGLEAVD